MPQEYSYADIFLTSSDEVDRTVYYDDNLLTYINTLFIDATGMGTMTFHLSEGSFGAGSGRLQIGDQGTATFIQTGGAIAPTVAEVGTGGTVELYGGNLAAGINGVLLVRGTVNQTGGQSVWDSIQVGYLGSMGTYNLSGGYVSGGPGLSIHADGVFNQSGGEAHGGPSGIDGTYNLSGGTRGGTYYIFRGTFNQTGGIHSAALAVPLEGTYNLSGGTLDARNSVRGASPIEAHSTTPEAN